MKLPAKTVIPLIMQGLSAWLRGEGERLPVAIERTATEGLFQRHDVIYMIGHIARSVTVSSLKAWVARVDGVSGGSSVREHVLCLHAGNLPMVGLQDLLATLLSGSVYHGKLSSKDPWLMDSLLRCLREYLPDQIGSWSVDLNELRGITIDKVLFAGSEASVPEVIAHIRSRGLLRETSEVAQQSSSVGAQQSSSEVAQQSSPEEAAPTSPGAAPTRPTEIPSDRFLARTARFSIAYFQDPDSEHKPEIMDELAEAILRYEGRGCRSVAVVVAPFGPQKELQAMRRFAALYPFSHTPNASVRYHEAYLASIDRFAGMAGPVLLCDNADLVGEQDVVVWLQDAAALPDLIDKFYAEVQSVYIDTPTEKFGQNLPYRFGFEKSAGRPSGANRQPEQRVSEPGGSIAASVHHALLYTEPLAQAQTPPIDWKPDGVDVLEWLHKPS